MIDINVDDLPRCFFSFSSLLCRSSLTYLRHQLALNEEVPTTGKGVFTPGKIFSVLDGTDMTDGWYSSPVLAFVVPYRAELELCRM